MSDVDNTTPEVNVFLAGPLEATMAARGPSPTYAKWEWQQITEQTPERNRFLAQVTPVLHIKSDSFRLPFVPQREVQLASRGRLPSPPAGRPTRLPPAMGRFGGRIGMGAVLIL